MLEFFVKFLLAASAIIVIILVMLQRGKGGGLAGALGGAGGQSAFGTKAGDLFTKITVGVASFWIFISVLTAIYGSRLSGEQISAPVAPGASQNQAAPSETPPAGNPANSETGKAEKGGTSAAPGATDKLPGATEKGATPRAPVGKRAEKAAEKATLPTPPSVPVPAAPTSTPPVK